jgi:hypothetical protein
MKIRHLLNVARAAKTIRLKSFAGDSWHRISLEERTCDCRQFYATQGRCPHLMALGIPRTKPFVRRTHPTFSQALSALVKSLRIRRAEDAVYWLIYLDTFKESAHRFRTARRILIGAAEDGHSIAVMEQVRAAFPRIAKPQTELHELAAEAVRICKVPNWWHSGTGGPDYIYSGMTGERELLYSANAWCPSSMTRLIERGVEEQNAQLALAGLMGLSSVKLSSTRQAELVFDLAQRRAHVLAERLAGIHLRTKSALSGDNNYLCQAVWMLAGGSTLVALASEPVADGEVTALLDQATERWKTPEPIPGWCCDGVHSAGDDVRFMGFWQHMFAVCRAFEHYGRVDPADEWLPQFQCWDGLEVDGEDRCEDARTAVMEGHGD